MNTLNQGQFGEVNVIKELFEKFNIPKTCVEFGAYDGITNSNTYYFWKNKGFKALLIEPDKHLFSLLKKNVNDNCTLLNQFVSIENNLPQIIKKTKFSKKIGLLSIDIDSNDLEIFKFIDHSSTYVVIIEFNNQFPVWVDYNDPKGLVVFRHSALAVLKYASKNGYKLFDVRGPNIILVNNNNLKLPAKYFPHSLEECFDYDEQNRVCFDERIIGSKFTTNAKIFTQKPNLFLKIKKLFSQYSLALNYFLRGKKIPNNNIPKECEKKILDSGLYL